MSQQRKHVRADYGEYVCDECGNHFLTKEAKWGHKSNGGCPEADSDE